MSKIAFIFAGQGSQYVGMGREIQEQFSEAREVFQQADASLNFNISDYCFEGTSEELNKTEITQPAILTTSVAILAVLNKYNIKPEMVAGLSLGEYSALVAANVMNFSDAVKLVNKRGKYMQEAVPLGVGGMLAVLGLDREKVAEVLKEVNTENSVVEISNLNCPGQIVVGGHKEALDKVKPLLEEKGAKRVVVLEVSGPFHTSLLQPASEKLAVELENVNINAPIYPIISNVTAKPMDVVEIKDLLKQQVMKTVNFEDSIKFMVASGIDTFIEIGPQKVLSGFVKKVDRKLTILNVEDMKSLEATLEKLGVKENA